MKNEAHARIKINQLLEEAGWRFFENAQGPANILLENQVKITQQEIDAWGNDYERTKNGALDFLLLDSHNKPVCVLEAKKESLHPLVAKDQARKYAKTVGAQYVILSNGIAHFLWDITKGNPKPIYKFPSSQEIGAIKAWNPDRNALATGTGKTLTAAAVIRLFLRTQNAKRVLFLVDRLELEDQAEKAFINYLKPDYSTFIYKEHKSDWHKADIVVTTIQSLMFNDKYRYDFSPSDFDLLISDESHRSIRATHGRFSNISTAINWA